MATHTYFTRAVDDIAAQNGVRYSTSRAFSVSPELKRLAAYKLKKDRSVSKPSDFRKQSSPDPTGKYEWSKLTGQGRACGERQLKTQVLEIANCQGNQSRQKSLETLSKKQRSNGDGVPRQLSSVLTRVKSKLLVEKMKKENFLDEYKTSSCEEKASLLTEALQGEPGSAHLWSWRAKCNYNMKDYANAFEDAATAIQLIDGNISRNDIIEKRIKAAAAQSQKRLLASVVDVKSFIDLLSSKSEAEISEADTGISKSPTITNNEQRHMRTSSVTHNLQCQSESAGTEAEEAALSSETTVGKRAEHVSLESAKSNDRHELEASYLDARSTPISLSTSEILVSQERSLLRLDIDNIFILAKSAFRLQRYYDCTQACLRGLRLSPSHGAFSALYEASSRKLRELRSSAALALDTRKREHARNFSPQKGSTSTRSQSRASVGLGSDVEESSLWHDLDGFKASPAKWMSSTAPNAMPSPGQNYSSHQPSPPRRLKSLLPTLMTNAPIQEEAFVVEGETTPVDLLQRCNILQISEHIWKKIKPCLPNDFGLDVIHHKHDEIEFRNVLLEYKDLLINLFFLYATIHDPNEKDNRNSLPLADRPSKKIVSHSEDEIKKQTEMAALMHRRRESIFGCENSRLPGSAEPTDMSETANVHKQVTLRDYIVSSKGLDNLVKDLRLVSNEVSLGINSNLLESGNIFNCNTAHYNRVIYAFFSNNKGYIRSQEWSSPLPSGSPHGQQTFRMRFEDFICSLILIAIVYVTHKNLLRRNMQKTQAPTLQPSVKPIDESETSLYLGRGEEEESPAAHDGVPTRKEKKANNSFFSYLKSMAVGFNAPQSQNQERGENIIKSVWTLRLGDSSARIPCDYISPILPMTVDDVVAKSGKVLRRMIISIEEKGEGRVRQLTKSLLRATLVEKLDKNESITASVARVWLGDVATKRLQKREDINPISSEPKSFDPEIKNAKVFLELSKKQVEQNKNVKNEKTGFQNQLHGLYNTPAMESLWSETVYDAWVEDPVKSSHASRRSRSPTQPLAHVEKHLGDDVPRRSEHSHFTTDSVICPSAKDGNHDKVVDTSIFPTIVQGAHLPRRLPTIMSYLGATTNGEAAKRHFADVLYIAISAVTGLTIASAKSILGSKRSHSVLTAEQLGKILAFLFLWENELKISKLKNKVAQQKKQNPLESEKSSANAVVETGGDSESLSKGLDFSMEERVDRPGQEKIQMLSRDYFGRTKKPDKTMNKKASKPVETKTKAELELAKSEQYLESEQFLKEMEKFFEEVDLALQHGKLSAST